MRQRDDVTVVFAALGDPVRRAIVDRLADGDATVNELASAFPISLQAVSRHIRVLQDAGVVTRRAVAQTRPVHLETSALARSVDWLEAHRRRLERRFTRLDELLERTAPAEPTTPTTSTTSTTSTTGTGDRT